MNATYNITDNRLKFWPPEARLTPEQDAKRKSAGFTWWPGRKCFAATWSPSAEDFILSFGCPIEADDTPDDVEARVERFASYAQDAETSAEYAAAYATDPTKANTERRARLAENRAKHETERAEYWTSRIAGAIRHVEYKDRPDVIARRIKGLEADLRKHEKSKAQREKFLAYWNSSAEISFGLAYKLLNYGSYPYDLWRDLESKKITPQEAKDKATIHDQDCIEYEQRWINHLNVRLEYERAFLGAVGGDPVAKLSGLKSGDKVIWRQEVCEVIKVNKATVQIKVPSYHWCKNGLKVDKTELKPLTE